MRKCFKQRSIGDPGITDDLERREGEHQRKPGWSGGHILQVGHRTTEEAAREWEEKQNKA